MKAQRLSTHEALQILYDIDYLNHYSKWYGNKIPKWTEIYTQWYGPVESTHHTVINAALMHAATRLANAYKTLNLGIKQALEESK